GFTLGNFLGILIEQKLALGSVVVRTITHKGADALVRSLRTANYGVTCLAGQGATGPVQVIFTVVPRRELAAVVGIIKQFDAGAFHSIDSLQSTSSGVAPPAPPRRAGVVPQALWAPLRLFI